MPPLLLMFTAIIVYMGGWILFLLRIDGLRKEFLLFRTADYQALAAGIRMIVLVMTGLLTVGAIFAFLLNNSTGEKPLVDTFSPPRGFSFVDEIDLSKQVHSSETLAEFTVKDPAYVGVFIAVRNINTSYFDLRVVGSDGYNSVVMHGEGYRADRDGGLWEETLPAGTYQLMLTSHQSPGTASVFLKTP
jgi:hypothetical protein